MSSHVTLGTEAALETQAYRNVNPGCVPGVYLPQNPTCYPGPAAQL